MFPSLLQPLVPHAHVLAGLYCQGTSHFQQAESHFAKAASLLQQQAEQAGQLSWQQREQLQGGFQMRDGPLMSAKVLQACAILSQVSTVAQAVEGCKGAVGVRDSVSGEHSGAGSGKLWRARPGCNLGTLASNPCDNLFTLSELPLGLQYSSQAVG